ncbi:hypothetical protein TRIATDRAFT_220698 [Trichoderma atroviride IMI 206040]|uniref:Heterokaryon incompatibility domain-containing protein n=1 Tax=Hypocrea atroviridis (strain ATCC 20476 / IMI 206040) TaxID=452589 RepID=G9NV45_HYPAI|nr:uncharacterized protein TRIATDRAFT_220698 [Trichoderma atroviride IMI 206040]EHK44868.1 hypothetical protein TRIATDRAFT_220698 [Trichoderma atroviride IMI 206040]
MTDTIDLGDGRCLPLGSNLKNALHHLRDRKQKRKLWIDALCINQQDIEERSHQVQLMAEIYQRCKSVVAYIGMPTPDSQLGFEILSYLANSNTQIGDDSMPWNYLNGNDVHAALRDIFERPYFQRVWVVQEAALAPQVRMQVGHLFFEWSGGASTRKFLARIKLAELSPSWQQIAELRDAVDFRPIRELLEQSLAAEAKRNGVIESPSLLDVVHSIRHRQAVDPRDRIYGVMSLVTSAEVAEMVPDYSMSWEETYQRFYEFALRQVSMDSGITLEGIQRASIQ